MHVLETFSVTKSPFSTHSPLYHEDSQDEFKEHTYIHGRRLSFSSLSSSLAQISSYARNALTFPKLIRIILTLALLSLLISIVTLMTLTPSLMPNDMALPAPSLGFTNLNALSQHVNIAYSTTLCTISDLESVLILATLLRQTGSALPLVILCERLLKNILQKAIINFNSRGKTTLVSIVEFEQSDSSVDCQHFSAALLWTLTDYDRIVFLNAKSVVPLKNTLTLFEFPAFASIRNTLGDIDTDVMVVNPNFETFQLLSEKLVESKFGLADALSEIYMDMPWLSRRDELDSSQATYPIAITISPKIVSSMSQYLSTQLHHKMATSYVCFGHRKPWDLYMNHTLQWDSEFDVDIFVRWFSAQRYVRSALLNTNDGDLSSLNLYNIQQEDMNKTKHWENSKRNNHVCNSYLEQAELNPSLLLPVLNKFSVLISTFNRVETVLRLIEHYSKSDLVDTVFISWHNPKVKPPAQLFQVSHAILYDGDTRVDRSKIQELIESGNTSTNAAVILVLQTTDSLNNRFNPIRSIRTPAVLMVDDDIRIPLSQLDVAFNAWKYNPDQLVGFYPRSHRIKSMHDSNDPKQWEFEYLYGPSEPKHQYSMMLTKGMFFRKEYLTIYTCMVPQQVHAYIDTIKNCEDITMNFIASAITGKAPLTINFPMVDTQKNGQSTQQHRDLMLEVMADFGQSDGISTKNDHQLHRSMCISDLVQLFGTYPLVDTDIEVSRYLNPAPWMFLKMEDWTV
ncbi:hypothetical protein BDV3_003243 [Batrachochytrium dendrobatidis]|uniref:Glycosyl transferase 64 domain-containing protein n=1 Tax=Batrachochytrium dendrobatidis (strain JEL423) TaxID=403673 RepID=A0A177WZ03_BATDL|nr:hypothetical protein BDEG_28468 [Batrachochytrium dendrobatidis JEL423]